MRKLSNYTEDEIVEIIEKISSRLAPKFVFPGYEVDDIKQEAFLLGIEALDRYDENYKLSSFLFSHINNRLKTLKRNEYYRMEQGSAKQIQETKKRINSPGGYSDKFFTIQDNTNDIYYRELIEKITEELPVENRSDFLRLINGQKIPQTRKETLSKKIKNIIGFEEYKRASFWEDDDEL